MPFFNVGDKVYNRENPDKIYIVKKKQISPIVSLTIFLLMKTEKN